MIATAVFAAVVAVTVFADTVAQYLQNYAAAPYVKAERFSVLTAEDLLADTPAEDLTPERASYLLGWLWQENVDLMYYPYTVSGVDAKDARTPAEAALIESAGYRIFNTEENTAFDSLLRQLRFRPVRGVRNLLIHRRLNERNFVASFRLRSFWGMPQSGGTPMPWFFDDGKLQRGEIFTAGGKAYLAGCFGVGGI